MKFYYLHDLLLFIVVCKMCVLSENFFLGNITYVSVDLTTFSDIFLILQLRITSSPYASERVILQYKQVPYFFLH